MRLALVLLAFLLPLTTQGASFDCAKASTPTERLICDNPYISKLDSKLAIAYKSALNNKQQADSIRHAQKIWISERDFCTQLSGPNNNQALCVLKAYEERLKALGLSARDIDPERTEKVGERYRYILNEDEYIEDQAENRPFCKAVLAALIKTKPSETHRGCIADEVLKLPGVSDPAWEKLDLSKHEELVKKMMTLSMVGPVEYFNAKKLAPQRFPTPAQLQLGFENAKQEGVELYAMHLPPELFGDRVLVVRRETGIGCGIPIEMMGEEAHGVWVTPDLKEIAAAGPTFTPLAGRPLMYHGRLYVMSAYGGGEGVDLALPMRGFLGTVCDISIIHD